MTLILFRFERAKLLILEEAYECSSYMLHNYLAT